MRVLVLVLVIGAACWWVVARKTGLVPSPTDVFAAQSIPVKVSVDIQAGVGRSWTFSPPTGKTPGLLQGRWFSRGSSAGIKGATDYTLISFEIRGPNNEFVQRLDHPVSGNFSLRFQGPAAYTFAFVNSGVMRSSARRITIEGTYQPD